MLAAKLHTAPGTHGNCYAAVVTADSVLQIPSSGVVQWRTASRMLGPKTITVLITASVVFDISVRPRTGHEGPERE